MVNIDFFRENIVNTIIIINLIRIMFTNLITIAHRGMEIKDKNISLETWGAYDNAIKYSPDYIECDVRKKSGELFISHDEIKDSNIEGKIKFKEWIEKYSKLKLYIENKEEGIEELMFKDIENIKKKNVILQSAYDSSIKKFEKKSYKVTKLTNWSNLGKGLSGIFHIINKNIGFPKIHFFIPHLIIIIFIRSFLGFVNHVYTVDNYILFYFSDLLGANGIFTDRIDRLSNYKKKRKLIHFTTHLIFLSLYNRSKIKNLLSRDKDE